MRTRLGAAAVGGLLLGLAFPPYDLWGLAPPAVAVLSLTTSGLSPRRGALVGLVYGTAFFLVLLDWLRVVGADGWIALSLFQAGFLAALGAGLAVVSRLPGWPLWQAALWVTQELLRDRVPFGGFPWGRLAFSQTATPLTPYAALGGAPAVTVVTALLGTVLAWAVLAARSRRLLPVLVAAATAPAVALSAAAVPLPTDGDPVTVGVVQGNVPRSGLDFQGQREAVLDNHVRATGQLAAEVEAGARPRPDLVIWPENSSDIDPYTDDRARARIQGAVEAVDVPVLVGAVVDGPDADHVQNMGIVWDPQTGPGETYTKRHPVPFGEYLPFREQLTPLISRFERIPRDFYAGDTPGVLDVGPARIGDVICFEIAYDEIVRDAVREGGRLIVVQTNNATYGHTGQPEQQLAMSRLRAVEHGRSVIVAATSGISAVIAPDGQVIDRSEEFTTDLMVEEVPQRDSLTIADQVGAVPEWLLAMVGAAAVLAAVAGRRLRAAARWGTRRRDPGGTSA